MTNRIEETITLVEQTGLRILVTKNKRALIKDWRNKATNDPDQIRDMLEKYPNTQIAAVVPDNMLVLDFDPRNEETAGEHEQFKAQLPETLMTISGRGDGGEHRWYRIPAGAEVSKQNLPKGVDPLNSKRYVILPPSLHHETGRPYTWAGGPFTDLPEHVLQALQPPRRVTSTLPPQQPVKSNGKGLVRTVAEAVEGERNTTLHWAACRAFDNGDEAVIQGIFDAAMNNGLPESEVTAAIDSARRTDRQQPEPYSPQQQLAGDNLLSPEPVDNVDGLDASDGLDGSNMGAVLNCLNDWFSRFIRTTSEQDIHLLSLWCAHTYVVEETYSTPRLQIDAIMRGSGKTTVLEHMSHLTHQPVQAASISSPALLTRMVSKGVRTILIDEVDRSLNPNKPGVEDLIAILNSGYKQGATRPVLVPGKNGEWDVEEMPTYSPVAMAGNAPHLPEDTRSRSIRVLLMPDVEGTVEPSDWEDIEPEANQLQADLSSAMLNGRTLVKQARPELPDGCIGRTREKWNPLARVAHVAGGDWPKIVTELINNDIQEAEMERQDGLANLPKSVQLIHDLAETWQGESFIQTSQILSRLQTQFPHRWSTQSPAGKNLTVQGMGRMLSQMKIYSSKDSGDKRGYYRNQFDRVFRQFNLDPQNKPSKPSEPA